jgi:hypothetical protein
VIRPDFRGQERFGVAAVGVADDGHVLAVGFERLQAAGRQVEVGPRCGRRPHVLLDAEGGAACRPMHHLHGDQAHGGLALRRGANGRHGIEEGQRDRRADAAEDGPA